VPEDQVHSAQRAQALHCHPLDALNSFTAWLPAPPLMRTQLQVHRSEGCCRAKGSLPTVIGAVWAGTWAQVQPGHPATGGGALLVLPRQGGQPGTLWEEGVVVTHLQSAAYTDELADSQFCGVLPGRVQCGHGGCGAARVHPCDCSGRSAAPL